MAPLRSSSPASPALQSQLGEVRGQRTLIHVCATRTPVLYIVLKPQRVLKNTPMSRLHLHYSVYSIYTSSPPNISQALLNALAGRRAAHGKGMPGDFNLGRVK